jgi:hypothetical protein
VVSSRGGTPALFVFLLLAMPRARTADAAELAAAPPAKVAAAPSDFGETSIIWRGKQHTRALYSVAEVLAEIMKLVRAQAEGDPRPEALLRWVDELVLSGRGKQMWTVVSTAALEDVGIANALLFPELVSLYREWRTEVGARTARSFTSERARGLLSTAVCRVACSYKSRWASNAVHGATAGAEVVRRYLAPGRQGGGSGAAEVLLLRVFSESSLLVERVMACAHLATAVEAPPIDEFFRRCEAAALWPTYGVLTALREMIRVEMGSRAHAMMIALGVTFVTPASRPEMERTWFRADAAAPSVLYSLPPVNYGRPETVFAVRAALGSISARALDKHTERGKRPGWNSVERLRAAAHSVGVRLEEWSPAEVARSHGVAPTRTDGLTLQQRFYAEGMPSAAPSRHVPSTCEPLFTEGCAEVLALERRHGIKACKQGERVKRFAAEWRASY